MSKREALAALSPYVPGTTIEEIQRKLGLEQIIKLASNENPLGSSPKALAAMRNLDRLHLYLDDAYPELRERLAEPEGLHFENVILGHGSNELVNIIAQAVVEPGDDVVMASPTFSLYALAAACQGGNVIEVPLVEGVHDLGAMLAAITPRTSLLFICDPNNPTGTALDPEALDDFLQRVPETVCVVLDRAYQEYMQPRPQAIERPNTVVLRTMSKIYGLASLRFGYGFADRELIAWLNRIRLPFNVSRPAALGAWGALDDAEFVATSVAGNQAGKQQLLPALQALGLHLYPTQANFYAVGVPVSATRAYEDFLQRGIIVRSGDALHMPNYLRITIGTPEQNTAVLAAFDDLVPQWRA